MTTSLAKIKISSECLLPYKKSYKGSKKQKWGGGEDKNSSENTNWNKHRILVPSWHGLRRSCRKQPSPTSMEVISKRDFFKTKKKSIGAGVAYNNDSSTSSSST